MDVLIWDLRLDEKMKLIHGLGKTKDGNDVQFKIVDYQPRFLVWWKKQEITVDLRREFMLQLKTQITHGIHGCKVVKTNPIDMDGPVDMMEVRVNSFGILHWVRRVLNNRSTWAKKENNPAIMDAVLYDCSDVNPINKILTDLQVKLWSWYHFNQSLREGVSLTTAEFVNAYNPTNLTSMIEPVVMVFDIETDNRYGQEFSNAEKDPVLQIACYVHGKMYSFVTGTVNSIDIVDQMSEHDDELGLLLAFCELIRSSGTNILVGHNIKKFDVPYIETRLSKYKKTFSYLLKQRNMILLDTMEWQMMRSARTDFPESVSLREVGKKYNVPVQKMDFDPTKISMCQQFLAGRTLLAIYNAKDVLANYGIYERAGMLPQLMVESVLCNASIRDLIERRGGFKFSCLLTAEGQVYREMIHHVRQRTEIAVTGGKVLKPISGIHRQVYEIDFEKMYPSHIIAYNICWSTIVTPSMAKKLEASDHEDGFLLASKKVGMLPRIEQKLCDLREEALKDGNKYRALALKTLANLVYGFMATKKTVFYRPDLANVITGYSRRSLTKLYDMVNDEFEHAKVINGDTDSIFVSIDEGVEDPDQYVQTIVDRANSVFKAPIRVSVKSKWLVLFNPDKIMKTYAGIKDGEEVVTTVGAKFTGRNHPRIITKCLEKCVRSVCMFPDDLERLQSIVSKIVWKLRNDQTNISDLIISEQIHKHLRDYGMPIVRENRDGTSKDTMIYEQSSSRVLKEWHRHQIRLALNANQPPPDEPGPGSFAHSVVVKPDRERCHTMIAFYEKKEIDAEYYVEQLQSFLQMFRSVIMNMMKKSGNKRPRDFDAIEYLMNPIDTHIPVSDIESCHKKLDRCRRECALCSTDEMSTKTCKTFTCDTWGRKRLAGKNMMKLGFWKEFVMIDALGDVFPIYEPSIDNCHGYFVQADVYHIPNSNNVFISETGDRGGSLENPLPTRGFAIISNL